MQAHLSEKSRHLVLRFTEGDALPRALLRALEEHSVSSGWLRGGGILTQVELRTYGERSRTRNLRGPVQLVSLEGSIGQLAGRPSAGMRAVLVHETDRGVETVAGEIANANIVALEAVVVAFDDLRLSRELDADSGTWMLAASAGASASPAPRKASAETPAEEPEAAPAAPEIPAGWGAAIEASMEQEREAPLPTPRAIQAAEGLLKPRSGDFVEHFAFGRCEVFRAVGDKIRIKAPRDGRIREISLAALKVTPLEGRGPRRSFRLERKDD